MSNLENLTQKIIDDAKKRASIILEEAEKENKEIINSKINEANKEKDRIIERATAEANLLKERVISNAELQVRNQKLKAKQEVIEKVFNLAKAKLKDMNEDNFSNYLSNTLKTIKLRGDEVLIIPERMKNKVASLDLPIKVSIEETVESGFIIQGSDIVLNYDFDSLVDYYRDELEAEIAKSLFKE